MTSRPGHSSARHCFHLANIADRIAGYRDALSEAGLASRARVSVGGFTVDGCRGALEQELRRADRPTAIFSAA